MREVTIEEKFGHYEVRAHGDFICSADTFAEAIAEAQAYLDGGKQ